MDDNTTSEVEEIKRTTPESQTEEKKADTEVKRPRYKNTVHLWEFLLELLSDDRCTSLIAWSRKDYGEFKLKNQEEVARRWGIVKHRTGMNYEKLSRAIRYYYHQGIIKKVPGQRLVYKFGQLPYEYKPRAKRVIQQEIQQTVLPTPIPDNVKQESFLPLTSLTPPPEIGYPYPLIPNLLPPVCSCCMDYRLSTTCPFRTFPGSPIVFPTSCGYAFSLFNKPPPSPLRSIPVSVITSTHT